MSSWAPFKEFVNSTVLGQLLDSLLKKSTDIPQCGKFIFFVVYFFLECFSHVIKNFQKFYQSLTELIS